MNHDRTHCIDFSEFCPEQCELAKLNRDLKNIQGFAQISYAHFLKSCMCPFSIVAKNTLHDIITRLMKEEKEK